jgi:hypothetical protein
MTIYNPEQYHTWNGYSWASFTAFIAKQVEAYKGCDKDNRFALGVRGGYLTIQKDIERIEGLPGFLNAYDAFSLLCAWVYLRWEELNGKNRSDDYCRAKLDVYEDCYRAFIIDYADTPEVEDVYNYVKRITGPALVYGTFSPFDSQLIEIFYALTVKKPRGTKQHLNAKLSIGDVRAMLGACVGQVIVRPYEDHEKQARIQALCKVLHKVFV